MAYLLAYFDPGSGSLVVQALVGGTAGLLVFGKYLWDSALVRMRGSHKTTRSDVNTASANSGEIPQYR